MRKNDLKFTLKAVVLVTGILLFGAIVAFGQTTVNLTAGPVSATLPDGSTAPMWGYICNSGPCAPLNTAAATNPAVWSPVVITVATGQSLTINLTNSLTFGGGGIPTSLVIVGQLGGGLGSTATSAPSPDHTNAQPLTWPIAGDAPGAALTGVGTPPSQGSRVQSFSTEVAAGATTALTWTAPRPGTYLLESGTHPSIQGPMGLYGMVVVTAAATGTAYPGVHYDADVRLLLSEIDPVQNSAVQTAVNTSGFSETAVWSGKPNACGDPAVHTCYPPAVNYTPLYYLVNGKSFNKTGANAANSYFASNPAIAAGAVLVRFVNAGLRMHIPSIVGAQTGASLTPGFSLIAEDGNVLPGIPRVQSEVFLAAGKTYDVMININAVSAATALPVFDRQLSLSNGGMQGYIGVAAAPLTTTLTISGTTGMLSSAGLGLSAAVTPDVYGTCSPTPCTPLPGLLKGKTFTISDVAKGVVANDVNVYGVTLSGIPTGGTVTLNPDGTFTFVPATAATNSGSFSYCANGAAGLCTTVTLNAMPLEAPTGIAVANDSYTSTVATALSIKPPGILANDKDGEGLPLTVDLSSISGMALCNATNSNAPCVSPDQNGGFNAFVPAHPASSASYAFTYKAMNAQGISSSGTATVSLNFPVPTNLTVQVLDAKTKAAIADYRWVIEEDRTFYVNPNCTKNPLPAGCPTISPSVATPLVFGTNFHTSNMPLIAAGCTGPMSCESGQTMVDTNKFLADGITPNPTYLQHVNALCDVGNGVCRPDPTGNGQTPLDPKQVHLDPSKRYYISVLPGDGADPFNAGYAGECNPADPNSPCGHTMGGAPIACTPSNGIVCTASDIFPSIIKVLVEPTPLKTAKLSVFVFEDDFPLNGEHDAGGGIDTLSPNEPGLGGFEITIFDAAGGTGDSTGQPTYDMFNMPLSNSLAGTIDPATQLDACPISPQVSANAMTAIPGDCTVNPNAKGCQKGIIGMIVTCPKYESDNVTLSPLAGHAVIANMYPGRYGVVATPAADRIARGEEWLQTNTLDGQKAHDSFLKVGEPAYFQEFGPAGFHVSIGFANPKIINARKADVCPDVAAGCTHAVKGQVTTARLSRSPDQRLYSSGSRDSFAFTQCYVSLGDPDGEDFAFAKCDSDGNFTLPGLPAGDWKITIFDQWNDQIVDGIVTPVRVGTGDVDMGQVAVHQWHANIYTSTFIDKDGNGVRDDGEPGLPLVFTNIRFRDGSFSNFNNTDLEGNAGYNEVFPLFNWYVIETDSTRYKNTGTHVVYDAGGPTDGSPACSVSGSPACGNSTIGHLLTRTYEDIPLPSPLSIPGAVYCDTADCTGASIAAGPVPSSPTTHSTGRIDPPWVNSYGWQGFIGQNSFLEFGKKPFAPNENGGIHGHVAYASTRPFDDPQLLLQTSWMPLVPNVTMNLYQESIDPITGAQTLKLVDTTQTSSFDAWAQGFRSDGIPNMNCPGQGRDTGANADLFFYSLKGQPEYLDWYNSQHGGPALTALPFDAQFKCYDGMHSWNQLQPAPYDGMYQFPSVTGINPSTGKPAGTNCHVNTPAEPWGCIPNPDTTDPYRSGAPMLPSGKYVVEVVVPPGFELVKEEDKNILIGDNYIAPVTQQFGGLGSIFILPDQAAVGTTYNPYNAQNPTTDFGSKPRHEGDTGNVETFWPCVGQSRVVPDYISLFPGSLEVAPFAGATRNLCDRKEVTLENEMSALAKFYIFTSTHLSSHFTGIILDDFTSEFDPFSPQFGEKFAPAYIPVSLRDFNGNEIARTHSDMFGLYNGLNYSSWEVNPPNPTGYGPTMMVVCMNDAGDVTTPDPLFQPNYSTFCYELPFMPGQTGYFDTPVVPTSAFSEGYNHPDCNYPDATPAIGEADGDGIGPWVSAANHTLTIYTINGKNPAPGVVPGNVQIDPYSYSGPSVTTAPFNAEKITRHYGFGARCTNPTAGNPTCNTASSVTIGGIAAPITGWSDTQITVTVPSAVPLCAIQQQAQYQGATAQCGELAITSGNGKQSIDTVTVTIGGKAPTRVTAPVPGSIQVPGPIQSAIDAARPGDLIIVGPGIYTEMVLMWKPVRLQGVGAASSIINASTQPAGTLLDPWRQRVVCLFGLGLDGVPETWDSACGTGLRDFSTTHSPQVDRLPLEATVGWDASLNGNLAEQLQEPTLMGAYEGAAITVLSRGVDYHGLNPWRAVTENGAFPDNTTLLQDTPGVPPNAGGFRNNSHCTDNPNPYPSNYECNPSSIDGLGIRNSSQGGGGILVHGWAHNIQIANNRVYNNTGTLSGGISIGQGEHPPAFLAGGVANTPPGSCQTSNVANLQLPYCFDMNVNVHNNAITLNSSLGDQLFSSTPAGAGGVSFCSGSDFYKFNHNWVCGNLSAGDGAGFAHLGFSYQDPNNATQGIRNNWILFNQSTNPTIVTNGGGLLVYSAPDTDVICSTVPDKDCPTGLADGSGPGLVIDSNLVLGNAAESGSGGGMRLQFVNGTEVSTFPRTPARWYSILVQNNIIANNVAGLDGAGVSLQDALAVNFINNTVISNDSTASSGILFNTLFAPLASSTGVSCTQAGDTQSCPQVAGLVSVPNSPGLIASLPATGITCPAGHSNCAAFSSPILDNNVFWQNRSFFIGVGPLGQGTQNQQKVVSLFDAFTQTPAPTQPPTDTTAANGGGSIITGGTGACVNPVSYWDLGVRGDTSRTGGSGFRLVPRFSVITDATDYPGQENVGGNPAVVSQYCNGSRVPPEVCTNVANCLAAYGVNPGTNENNAPNPIFSLTPTATVDEGNNWVNIRFGPLSLTHPASGATLGNFAPASSTSSVVNLIPSTQGGANGAYTLAPAVDFFGNPRKNNNAVDAGAIEFVASGGAPIASVTPTSLAFANVAVGSTSAAQTLTLRNTGNASLTGITVVVTAPFLRPAGAAGGTCTATLTVAAGTCTINVQFRPTAAGAANGTVTITANVPVTGSPVALTGTGGAAAPSAGLTPTSWLPATGPCGGSGQPACPTQVFQLTNTGTSNLTGITQGVLGGINANQFTIVRASSTCGPAGNGQLLGQTTLAPGAVCRITVSFAPTSTGAKNATLSVTDAAGTQTSTLTGTRNP